jgi:PAS domain S-box-containing protein
VESVSGSRSGPKPPSPRRRRNAAPEPLSARARRSPPTRNPAPPTRNTASDDPGRALAVLRAAQRALVRAKDEPELLDLICGIAVNEAGYRLAWAGLADEDPGQTIRTIAAAGIDAVYLESLRGTWSDTPLGRGPAGTAIRTNRPALGRDFATDPDLAPWRKEALEHGFASALALPLRTETVPFGVLSMYAATADAFSAADVDLLTYLAEDLAFGMNTLRERGHAEVVLRRSERNLAEAQRISHIGSWEWDLTTGTAQRSDELHRIYGVEPGTIANTNEAFLAFVHPDDRARVEESERVAISGGGRYAQDYRGVRPDGTIRLIRDEAEAILGPNGATIRMVGTVRDVTEQGAAEAERAMLAAAVEQTADAVWIKSTEGIITYVNRSFGRVYGYEPEEIVGAFAGIVDSGRHERGFFDAIWALVGAGETWSGLIVNRRKDGSLVELEAVISGIRAADGTLSFMQTDRDVTRERQLEESLARRAHERSVIEAALVRIDPSSPPEAIAAAACAELIGLPEIDAAFVIELDREDRGQILAVEGAIASAFATNRRLPPARARYLYERASSGVWTEEWRARPEDGEYGQKIAAAGMRTVAYAPLHGPNGLIGVVGLAIQRRNNAAFIEQLPVLTGIASILGTVLSPGIEARYSEDSARARTQGILDAAAFRPHFQPIVELHTGAVTGYEALSRFADGVPPDITFALAARCGLGLELEEATIRAALVAATVLPPTAYLSLNVSHRLIGSGRIRDLLAGHAREIVLEITEHDLIDDYPSIREDLAALGPLVRLAVDDAGAGYASLRHILELAPDFVKLDIGLIRGIDADPARQALIAGMGYFATKRKLRLVAEGVETVAELKSLLGLGVWYGQGYLLGRPEDGGGPGPWPTTVTLPAA